MVTIRPIQPSDAPAYFLLRELADAEYPEYVGISAERELLAGPERIADLLAAYERDGVTIFGAFMEQALVGIVCASHKTSPRYRHKVFLWGMYVMLEYRRQKVGQLLVEHLIDWASHTRGLLAIQLQVTTTNSAACALYKRLGFTVYGTERAALFAAGRYHDVHLMELTLEQGGQL